MWWEMGLKIPVYPFENGIESYGNRCGRVINQSLTAGTNFKNRKTISLILIDAG